MAVVAVVVVMAVMAVVAVMMVVVMMAVVAVMMVMVMMAVMVVMAVVVVKGVCVFCRRGRDHALPGGHRFAGVGERRPEEVEGRDHEDRHQLAHHPCSPAGSGSKTSASPRERGSPGSMLTGR